MAEHVLCSSEVTVLDSDNEVIKITDKITDDCNTSAVPFGRVDYAMVSLRSGIVSRALYRSAALASEHAVITIRNHGIGGDKRVIMIPMVCLSGTSISPCPSIWTAPNRCDAQNSFRVVLEALRDSSPRHSLSNTFAKQRP